MIHTIRAVAVGDQESKIDSPIILYRGDREVEVEFTINGSKFTFTNGGNVIKSTNATHGQLVINTPTGENMFSEVTECHDGKVVFVITKEMIDELIEVGFYSFQIRLFDESQVSRVTIPPVLKGIDIRNPIAAEDETNVVNIGLVDYAVVVKDEFEDLSTFLPDGNYNKTEWESKDVISGAKLNKIEDALYNINSNMEDTDLALLNRVENINKTIHGEIDKLRNELESEVEELERDLNNNVERFKVDINGILEGYKSATTVGEARNNDLKIGEIVQTYGYHYINDGGANTYIVIPDKLYSYDIECKEYALRPIITSDVVCPRQFGTMNDGVNGDNAAIQACFDFVRDYNISVIDGRNLLYTTDSSTPTYHDHYGVVIHQPVTLRNYKGQLKDDACELTSIIDMMQVENDFREYLIENCEFDGKYGVISNSNIGREDGGRHCICFYGEEGMFPNDFIPMGNITIKNCRFLKPDGYGIFMSPADCVYNIEGCYFNTNGPCVLSYATTTRVRDCNAVINSSYKTMVYNFLHDEMEMGSRYTGLKTKSFYINNCHVSNGCVLKIEASTQAGLHYDNIVIENSSASTTLFEIFNRSVDTTNINTLILKNTKGNINIKGNSHNNTLMSNGLDGKINISGNAYINEMILNTMIFSSGTRIYIDGGKIDNWCISDSKTTSLLGRYNRLIGINTSLDNKDVITNLYMNNFEWYDSSRIIEAGIENIYIDNLHLHGDIKTGFDLIYNRHSAGGNKIIIKNSIFELPTADWCYLISNECASSGKAILVNCMYTNKLDVSLNGMSLKKVNVEDLNG